MVDKKCRECSQVMYRKDSVEWVWEKKLFCNKICQGAFNGRIHNEVRKRLRTKTEQIRKEVLEEWLKIGEFHG